MVQVEEELVRLTLMLVEAEQLVKATMVEATVLFLHILVVVVVDELHSPNPTFFSSVL